MDFEGPKGKDLGESVEELGTFDDFALNDLEVGKKLEVKTQSRTYTIERREDGLYISGHPEYCPEPTKAYVHGSTAGGTAIKQGRIVVGGRLEFSIPDRGKPITTSEIESFEEAE